MAYRWVEHRYRRWLSFSGSGGSPLHEKSRRVQRPDMSPRSGSTEEASFTAAESEQERLFQHSLDLLCVAGQDGLFRKVNPSWTRVLGWTSEELLARPVIDFVHPEDRARTLDARRELGEGVPLSGFENRYLCKDGTYRWLSWQSTIEPGANAIFGVARDVTERRRADHEQFIVAKLESAGVLAAGLAHDFNNLLAGLLLNLEMIPISGRVTARQEQHLRQARQAIEAAQALTDQLVMMAEGGASVCAPTSIIPLIQRAVDGALSGSNLDADCTFEPGLPCVDVDAGQVGQALRAILLNARDAMPAGGKVRVSAKQEFVDLAPVSGRTAGDYVRISIEDDGAGIPPADLARIFDPYFSTKQRGEQKGMGLGLTICRTVFQKHGGFVTIESELRRGTTVHAYLPTSVRGTGTTAIAASGGGATPRVLVLEDDPNLQGIVEQTLAYLGYKATVVSEGESVLKEQAAAVAAGTPYALYLLDLTVRGGMGGQGVLASLKRNDPQVRAVLMTGYTHEAAFRDYARLGFKAALAKPFSAELLRATLAEVLA